MILLERDDAAPVRADREPRPQRDAAPATTSASAIELSTGDGLQMWWCSDVPVSGRDTTIARTTATIARRAIPPERTSVRFVRNARTSHTTATAYQIHWVRSPVTRTIRSVCQFSRP